MVASDKYHFDQSEPDASAPAYSSRNGSSKNSNKSSLEEELSSIADKMNQARANREHAESAREKITAEIMEATKRLYQALVEEGEQTLEQAKQIEAESELRLLESQREVKHAQDLKTEAESYRSKVISQTRQQSQDMLHEAQTIKADAVAFREQVLSEVKQQTAIELNQAQLTRIEAEAYREQVISETQRQAEELLEQARQIAQQEGSEVRQKYSLEAQRLLAQAEMIREAAREELEAQRLYSQAANLETESRGVLDQARAKVSQITSPVAPSNPVASTVEEILHRGALSSFNYEAPSTEPAEVIEDEENGEPASEALESASDDRKPEVYSTPPSAGPSVAPRERERSRRSKSEEPQTVRKTEPVDDSGVDKQSSVASMLASNELVMGIEINDESKAYPLKTLSEQRVINDSLSGVGLVMTVTPPSELGMMFKRDVDGLALTFEPVPESDDGIALMKDQETGTLWEILTGRAVEGPMKGNELERMNTEYSFWFAWSQLHPDTQVYQQD